MAPAQRILSVRNRGPGQAVDGDGLALDEGDGGAEGDEEAVAHALARVRLRDARHLQARRPPEAQHRLRARLRGGDDGRAVGDVDEAHLQARGALRDRRVRHRHRQRHCRARGHLAQHIRRQHARRLVEARQRALVRRRQPEPARAFLGQLHVVARVGHSQIDLDGDAGDEGEVGAEGEGDDVVERVLEGRRLRDGEQRDRALGQRVDAEHAPFHRHRRRCHAPARRDPRPHSLLHLEAVAHQKVHVHLLPAPHLPAHVEHHARLRLLELRREPKLFGGGPRHVKGAVLLVGAREPADRDPRPVDKGAVRGEGDRHVGEVVRDGGGGVD
eukprot:182905-Rhodomonas_salina.2